jgi:hypothetical protein
VQDVVHRVMSVTAAGISTKGDGNRTVDPWVLPAHHLKGRVVAAQRGTQRRVVAGGRPGRRVERIVRLGYWTWRLVGQPPHRLYEYLVHQGPFDRLLPRRQKPRQIRYQVRGRAFLKLVAAGREIGRYDNRRRAWQIKRPYRLFVDEQALECPPPEG